MKPLDYSQYRTWLGCPLRWYTKYILGLHPKRPIEPRDDALTLGSLFHNGMENWYEKREPRISVELISDLNPSKECLDLAQGLILGYTKHYPSDPWTVEQIEKALTKKLDDELSIVAKVDQIARVDEPMFIDSGHPGYSFELSPGIYSVEHKTKAQSKPFAGYLASWQANMQASFQLLTLREHYENVQGVIVNVAEKPNFYQARRKCQACNASSALKGWGVDHQNLGKMICPLCGNSQKVKPYEPKKENKGKYYRIMVTRDPLRLAKDSEKIISVANQMKDMIREGERGESLNEYENDEYCINPITMRQKCEYFEAHVNMVPVEQLGGIEKVEDPYKYIGLENEATEE